MDESRNDWLLVVEDNLDIWHILKLLIPQVLPNVSIKHASNDEAALRCLTEGSDKKPVALPKAILQDLYMPEREQGLSLVKRFKQPDSLYREIPLIVMSSSTDEQDINNVEQLGVDAYLIKPMIIGEWLERLAILQYYYQGKS